MLGGLKYRLLILAALSYCTSGFTQDQDSVQVLKEVVVASERLQNHSVGYRLEQVDTNALYASQAASLTELLTRNTTAQIRSFGVNGVTTINMRGSGSSHTAILWNGINLQSPSSGVLDIGLLPMRFLDEVEVQSGGAASLFGAGAIGGVLHLNNKPQYGEGITTQTGQSIGSFGRHQQYYQMGWGNQQLFASIKYFQFSADNDFKFINTSVIDSPQERRQHNAFHQQGILSEVYWKSNNHQFALRTWLQDNELEVPSPITAAGPGNARQQDRFHRSVLSWETKTEGYSSILRLALVNHQTDFNDTLTNQASSITYHSQVTEYELNKQFNSNIQLSAGINNTFEWIDSGNHGTDSPNRNRTAVFMALRKDFGNRVQANLRVREELVSGDLTPISPSLGLEYYLTPELRLKSNFSRNYLIPTFNQLYWSGAGGRGNPDLNSERSWSQELGLAYEGQIQEYITISSELTGFSNQVNDWIIWTPVTASIWSPLNIKKVWSRGLEWTGSMLFNAGRFQMGLRGSYGWTRSTNREVANEGNQAEVDKQLIYTPEHTGKINLDIGYLGFRLSWWHYITGRQFTTGENTRIQQLDRFGVSTIILSKGISWNSLKADFLVEVNNLFDHNYLIRAGYPMPLRNFRVGINIKL